VISYNVTLQDRDENVKHGVGKKKWWEVYGEKKEEEPLEEELPLIEEYGSRHPSTYTRGPDEEGHQPRDWGGWNAERINQIANYARNVFDALFQWNPSWGRPPDLPPHASPEDVNDWYRQAAQMKADWEEEHGEELRPPSPEELEAINDPKHGWLPGEGRQWDDEERGYRSKLRRQGSDDWDTRLVDPAKIKEYMAHLDSLREQGLLTTQKRVGVQAPAGGSQGRRSQQRRQRRRSGEQGPPPQPQPPGGDNKGEPMMIAWQLLKDMVDDVVGDDMFRVNPPIEDLMCDSCGKSSPATEMGADPGGNVCRDCAAKDAAKRAKWEQSLPPRRSFLDWLRNRA